MPYKENIQLICQVKDIGKIRKYTRANKTSFSKRMLTLETEDGQVLYCELRRMNLLDGMSVGDIGMFKISFAGSEKNGKKYNNIFINDIRKQ